MEVEVIVADDDPIFCTMIVRFIGMIPGVKVYKARDGDELVRLAKKLRPQIIFTDYNMPGMNGLEAVVRIKEFLPDVEAVLITNEGGDRFAELQREFPGEVWSKTDLSYPHLKDLLQRHK